MLPLRTADDIDLGCVLSVFPQGVVELDVEGIFNETTFSFGVRKLDVKDDGICRSRVSTKFLTWIFVGSGCNPGPIKKLKSYIIDTQYLFQNLTVCIHKGRVHPWTGILW